MKNNNTSNKLNNHFYRNPVRIPDYKTDNRKEKENKRINFSRSILVYLVLCCALFITILNNESSNFNAWMLIKSLGVTSSVFIIGYFGLKLNSFRFSSDSRIRRFVEKLYISKKMTVIHLCIILASLLATTFTTTTDLNSEIQTEKADLELIKAIEEKFNRTDITKIVKVDDKYIIYFSNESVEVFEFTSE